MWWCHPSVLTFDRVYSVFLLYMCVLSLRTSGAQLSNVYVFTNFSLCVCVCVYSRTCTTACVRWLEDNFTVAFCYSAALRQCLWCSLPVRPALSRECICWPAGICGVSGFCLPSQCWSITDACCHTQLYVGSGFELRSSHLYNKLFTLWAAFLTMITDFLFNLAKQK